MRINIRLSKKTVIHNSVELCTPENWRRFSFAFFAKYLPPYKLVCGFEKVKFIDLVLSMDFDFGNVIIYS